jgi:hypothetical protein
MTRVWRSHWLLPSSFKKMKKKQIDRFKCLKTKLRMKGHMAQNKRENQ